jgi:nucleoside-diphosphate-sugar epimerase
VRRRVADPRRARARLGWSPQVDLERGLALTLGRPRARPSPAEA